ncbi:methyltransferase, putative [Plasmodium berghei]|uniref:tRNA (guanine-N(7)-)-methyltransferase n=2 Tax=Plasmodium berghei TaxID=5821 RepID=A0A509ALP4_PLABA|nr:tRNA (guanine-N(7)-)-methyltransferase, putative [Plasmodium berghei ANKA]CXI42818.1 methyltransferase, putative [Plasmodium berghei]SCM22191.1 methyltransferase, putative [Plasmodium berghei]SCN25328.1 methyltransferase, putative [Plasmodium berghei]SCO60298.1 methyltransferase, putative [Plasmodium berghei]SCO61988.1 methyltransferase, putative [Plasmodium berghei]|eukprot:XP_034421561.1 tRNA (guanine-N(7)-)-methyltransferase, putative [Plasmodium berghei ANKA]
MKKHKTPCKKFYRQRAHCNPLSDSYIKYPLNDKYVDWGIHYPLYFRDLGNVGKNEEEQVSKVEKNDNIQSSENNTDADKLFLNTNKYPICYENKIQIKPNNFEVNFLDIGCGYGGLLFELCKVFDNKLILGLEIRDKITNYVGEKINTYRKNNFPNYNNISVIRTNAMKFLPNYIKKNQIEKMFFCFPDPHFKKPNWRRRIITIESLSLYYHLLQKNGLIYFITDVFTLYLWVKFCLNKYQKFKILSEEEYKNDICIKLIHEKSEESKRVKTQNKNMYFCVAQKI